MRRDLVASLATGAAIAAVCTLTTGVAHAGTGSAETPIARPHADTPSRGASTRRLAPGGVQLPTLHRIDCRRWQALASQLGETIAGRRMRQTETGEACRQHGEQALAWDWPWSEGALSAALPPQVVSEAGVWQVRCEAGDGRRRCALVHQFVMGGGKGELTAIQGSAAAAADGSRQERQDKAISTHFVIDTIAGRESVLWRVFVPSERDAIAANATMAAPLQGVEQGTAAATPSTGATPGSRRQPRSWRLQILADRTAEKVEGPVYCSAAGCLLEVGPKQASEIVNRLVDGSAVEVRIEPGDASAPANLTLPARGFAASFKDLMRHRRDEHRPRQ